MAIGLGLGLAPTIELRTEAILESPYHGALRLYEDSKKIKVSVEFGTERLSVPTAFVESNDLEEIFAGERYAGTIGGMFFISKKTPKHYRHFAAFHELAEHAAPRGLNTTGLAKHFQALIAELGYAKNVLSQTKFGNYLKWRKSIERSNFFSLKDNGLIAKISEKLKELFQSKKFEGLFQSLPQYLTYGGKQLVEAEKITQEPN